MIYDALGAPHPIFAHVPLILAEDRSKLSKRHGASSVGELRAAGYLPDAAENYLLLLGWSHPQSKEFMPRDEMIKAFSIERIGKSAAVFDKNKLAWMNGQYIRKLPLDTLVKLVEPYMPESLRARYSATERREIVAILQDSLDVLGDFPKRAAIFEPEVEYEPDTKTLLDSDSAKRVLGAMVTRLHAHGGPVTPESFKEMILSAGAEVALKGKDLYFPIRGAMTGSVHGPDLTRVAAVKGRDAVTRLLEGALK